MKLTRWICVLLSFITVPSILPAQTLVLAVGLEKLVPTYAGPAIRIQRAGDNAQADIGFAAGSNALDQNAVTAFLGQAQGYITTLYAQDGSGHNVLAPTTSGTDNMPTINVSAPTGIVINGTTFLTARNVKQPFGPGTDGNLRYFVLPSTVSINKSQASAFLACRLDCQNAFSGGPMSLFEVGDPTKDAFDIMSSSGGIQGLTHSSAVTFGNNNVNSRTQPTVIGLVSSNTAAPVVYFDGVAHAVGGSATPSITISGGYLMAGTGTGLYYGIGLFATYNFLGFELYNGSVSASTAASISAAMTPQTPEPYNLVGDGDSITQGTGDVYGFNMLRYVEPLLGSPANITNIAVYGTTSYTSEGHSTYPTAATSNLALLYGSQYVKNVYYVDIGTNDIHALGSSAATTFAVVQQALQGAKALGYTTIGATLLHENGETSAQATQIDSFNTMIRAAQGSSYMNALIDYAADPRLGIVTNYYPTYSGDGTHPNDAGYRVMAQDAAPIFNQFIGTGPTSTPTLPQWGLLALGGLLLVGAAVQLPRLSAKA